MRSQFKMLKMAQAKNLFTIFRSGLLVSFVAILLSCNSSDNSKPDGKIRFSLNIKSPSAMSRVTTDKDLKTHFIVGDAIGVYAVKHAEGTPAVLAASGNYMDNQKLILKENGSWDFESEQLFPEDGSQLDFYLYFPYNKEITDPTNMAITTDKDQSSVELFSANIFATGSIMNQTSDASLISMELKHELSLIEVKVTGTAKGAKMSHTVKAYAKSLATSGNFNLSEMEITPGTVNIQDSIQMMMVESEENMRTYTYRALAIPQTVEEGKDVFTFKRGGMIGYWLEEEVNFPKSTLTHFDITLRAPEQPRVEIYDDSFIYPVNGLSEAVVFAAQMVQIWVWVYLAIDEGYEQWATENIMTGAYNAASGYANTAKVREVDETFAKHPAFKWCEKYGEGSHDSWVLPAASELSFVSIMYAENPEKYDKQFIKAGGKPLSESIGWFWSSVENDKADPVGEGENIYDYAQVVKFFPELDVVLDKKQVKHMIRPRMVLSGM